MKSTRESGHPGIQTCHLCGKVQCGQRLGRVKCCLCSRIFCLQQLQRKFGIIAVANDPCFKCPRCTGVCCCVCNCQRPPPHVHCKVYKVRQNKTKPSEHRLPAESVPSANEGNRSPSVPPMLEMSGAPGSQKDMFAPGSQKDMFAPKLELSSGPLRSAAPGTEVPQPKLETPVQPGVSETRSRGFQENTQQNTFDSVPRIPSLTTMDGFYSYPGHEESFNTFPSNWQDSSNTWPFGHTDIPGIQNNDWLTQLNLTILDNANPNTTSVNEVTDMQNNSILSSSVTFLDSLRLYFENYGDPTDFVRVSMISFSNNE